MSSLTVLRSQMSNQNENSQWFEPSVLEVPSYLIFRQDPSPICSMYGIFTYICHRFEWNAGKFYTWSIWVMFEYTLASSNLRWRPQTLPVWILVAIQQEVIIATIAENESGTTPRFSPGFPTKGNTGSSKPCQGVSYSWSWWFFKTQAKIIDIDRGHYINQQKKTIQYTIKGEIHQIYQTYLHQVGYHQKWVPFNDPWLNLWELVHLSFKNARARPRLLDKVHRLLDAEKMPGLENAFSAFFTEGLEVCYVLYGHVRKKMDKILRSVIWAIWGKSNNSPV